MANKEEKKKVNTSQLKVKKDLTQGDLELWIAGLRTHKPPEVSEASFYIGQVSLVEYYGVALRAACDAGWIDGLSTDQVNTLPYKEVARLGQQVWDTYMDVTTIDKKK